MLWWEESGLRFECQACGRCCGGGPGLVRVSTIERAKMEESLGLSDEDFINKYMTVKAGVRSLRELENYDCVMYERNSHKCRIYKIRPLQCRLFPFWPSMLRDKSLWNYYAKLCPGMNKGKYYKPELLTRFLKLRQAAEI